jgi:hypothetical protein
MNFKTFRNHNRQKGMALIISIGFLAVLSILGAVVMRLSTDGLSDSATSLPKKQSFYAADRSVEYAMNRDLIIHLPVSSSVNLVTAFAKDASGTTMAKKHKEIIDSGGVGELLSGTVADIGPRTLPPAMAEIHGTEFGANLYHVNVKASAPMGGTTRVDAAIVRLFKIDDDTIFRTSSGG